LDLKRGGSVFHAEPSASIAQMESTPVTLLLSFLKSESAATAAVYGLIATGIALTIVNVAQLLGMDLNGTFSSMAPSAVWRQASRIGIRF
jgi:Flp pilus assembly pilin Flp